MSFITSQIILSGYGYVSDINNLIKCGVTHILSVASCPLPTEISDKYETKFIECDDSEDVDLFHKFEECIQFIETALLNPKSIVIVHCQAGQSRSVCILTAYLMKTQNVKLTKAEDIIRSKHGIISMNKGFIRQLLLFEVMQCKIDECHPAYIHYKLQCLKNQIDNTGIEEITLQKLAEFKNDVSVYKCRKCRKRLFGKGNVYPHTVDLEKAFFTRFEDSEQFKKSKNKCSSLFLEPMSWMQKDILGNLTGKILCPHCSEKLGKFNWYGSQCSCGKWVTPALQIHSSKLDVS